MNSERHQNGQEVVESPAVSRTRSLLQVPDGLY